MPGSLFSMSTGKDYQLKQVLHAQGLNEAMVDALLVIDDPEHIDDMTGGSSLARWWVQQLKDKLKPPDPDFSELFRSPLKQLENILGWADQRGWGLDTEWVDAIDTSGPWYHGGLVVDVIAVYLPGNGKVSGIQRTFEELWTIASARQPGRWRYEMLASDPKHLRLLDGIEHLPGIRRVTIDLGANWDNQNGIRPMDVRGKDSLHAEVLAAAAHFPYWVQAMDRERVPCVWMPGYQVTIPGQGAWRDVPYLSWDRDYRGVRLDADWDDNRSRGWACPVRRES